jgi:hypothetical protein
MSRSRAIQVYLKPGLYNDQILLDLWEASREQARPQEIFRTALLLGIDEMIRRGQIPPSIESALDLKERLRRNRRLRATDSSEQRPDKDFGHLPDDHEQKTDPQSMERRPNTPDKTLSPRLVGELATDAADHRDTPPIAVKDPEPAVPRTGLVQKSRWENEPEKTGPGPENRDEQTPVRKLARLM